MFSILEIIIFYSIFFFQNLRIMAEYMGLSQHIDFCRLPSPGERFELIELIGEGTYGEVYNAKDRTTGKHVAIKILETITDNLEEIEEEYLVLRDLSHHPNLPTFIGIFLKRGATFEDDQLWFVMEVNIKHIFISTFKWNNTLQGLRDVFDIN